ncbi:MAG TPA: glycosyltransferase family 4 protein, partial [Planctomycetota bacterium]|nr:glycosyltransferase family 4 protein [Planctomycetota bacterium]
WLVAHGRTRSELRAMFPRDRDRLFFVPDTWINRLLWRIGRTLPHHLDLVTVTAFAHIYTGLRERRMVRRLVKEMRANVVHQPIPVSAKEPSVMTRLGAPLVIGPLNGNMDWPPSFPHRDGWITRLALALARIGAGFFNYLFPGKQQAAAVLVANERTRRGLPAVRGQIGVMPENGVDLRLWQYDPGTRRNDGVTRFVYLGRLEELKGVRYLMRAFAIASRRAPMRLEIIGDGSDRAELERMREELDLGDRVTMAGWVVQELAAARLAISDVLVMPSLRDCGGAVILEAMASGLAVIATAWGGPLDYVDETSGILVPPNDEESFVNGLAEAMVQLALDPDLRRRMGEAGRRRVLTEFDWERKVDQMIEVYEAVRAGQPLPQSVPRALAAAHG